MDTIWNEVDARNREIFANAERRGVLLINNNGDEDHTSLPYPVLRRLWRERCRRKRLCLVACLRWRGEYRGARYDTLQLHITAIGREQGLFDVTFLHPLRNTVNKDNRRDKTFCGRGRSTSLKAWGDEQDCKHTRAMIKTILEMAALPEHRHFFVEGGR